VDSRPTASPTEPRQGGNPADTTIRYVNNLDFNARVEPIWHNIKKLRPKLGFIGYFKERFRVKRLVKAVNEGLQKQGVDPAGWDRREGDCVCNMRIEKLGAIHDLRNYARERLPSSPLPHLLQHRDRNAIYLPLEFTQPFRISDKGRNTAVGSAVNLHKELQAVEALLRAQETLDPQKMVPFMHADSKAIDMYESKMAHDPMFWAKFGYVVLKKLTDMSAKTQLPIIFA
jgi:hypothetical protein